MFGWIKAVGDRLRGTRERALSLVSSWLANALWLIESKFLNLAKEAYGKNSVVYACLRMLSQSLAEPPLKAYQVNGDDKIDLPLNHPLPMLIKRPNELMTEYEFWELTGLYVSLGGRAVWWKERNNVGEIIALWPLRPDRVGPVYSNDPDQRVIAGYAYAIPGTGQTMAIARKDVLAFNLPDPSGESGGIVEGLGPAQVIAPEISADNEATQFVGALLANYAAPSVVVGIKGEIKTDAEVALIKSHFRSQFGGARRGEPAILDAGATVQILGFNLQQLEFPGVRRNSEARICAAFGVPPVLVGISAGLDSSSSLGGGGVVTQMRQYFTETTLMGYWRRFCDQYQNDVVFEFGEEITVEFDLSNIVALAESRLAQVAPIEKGFDKGAVTRNEYRQKVLHLETVDGGDVFLVPANMLEVSAASTETVVKAAERFLELSRRNGHAELEGVLAT